MLGCGCVPAVENDPETKRASAPMIAAAIAARIEKKITTAPSGGKTKQSRPPSMKPIVKDMLAQPGASWPGVALCPDAARGAGLV